MTNERGGRTIRITANESDGFDVELDGAASIHRHLSPIESAVPLRSVLEDSTYMHENQTSQLMALWDADGSAMDADEFVHIHAVEIERTDDGTAWGGRGGAVRIKCYSENGGDFDICLGFHKGIILAWAEPAHQRTEAEDSFDLLR